MKCTAWLGGIVVAVWLGGCTESNPFYVPPDAEDTPTDGFGDVPPVDDGGDADGPRDDAGEVPVDVPPDVDDVPADTPDVTPDVDDVPVDTPDVTPDVADVPADTPDVTPDVADVPADVDLCGNGTVDPGEECDDASAFCVDCALAPPAGWLECTDAAGNTAFFLIEDWPGNHSANAWRDHCRTTIEGLSPAGYAFLGLATFYDQDLWDCVEPSLTDGTSYWAAARQDPGASDFGEPGGGWYWSAWDGAAWTNVAPIDAGAAWLGASYDNGGGTAPANCARLAPGGGSWSLSDYSCTSDTNYDGICMIRY
jgi:hypothetical protein